MIVEDFCRVNPAKCHVCHSATATPVVDTGGTVTQGTSRYRVYICAGCVKAMAHDLVEAKKVDWAVLSAGEVDEYQAKAVAGDKAVLRLLALEGAMATISTLVDL